MANSSWFSFKIRIVSNTNKHIVLNIFDSQGNEMKKYKIYKTKKKDLQLQKFRFCLEI